MKDDIEGKRGVGVDWSQQCNRDAAMKTMGRGIFEICVERGGGRG